MKLFGKIAVVGTGLIGGSIGLELRQRKLCDQVIGVAAHNKSLAMAKKIGAIDIGSTNLSVIKDADLVILAVPVAAIIKIAPGMRKMIKKECIVIDVGSTKQEIVARLDRIFPNYLGTHPLAGSERRGIANAKAELFKNSLCLLTPSGNTALFVRKKIEQFWKGLGAKVFFVPADKHDEILAFVSHLPHVAAFSLIGAIPGKFLNYASSGLKDTTRIAASDSEIWVDIFMSNKKNITWAIRLFEERLRAIKQAIKKNDKRLLGRMLLEAKAKRNVL